MAAISLQSQDIGQVINEYKLKPLTTENVARAILDMQIENPVDAFKQSVRECGWAENKTEYKSKSATVYNNVFGMRKATQRLTTALDSTYKGHATYSHWIYSVLDYKYWQQYNPKRKNEHYKKYLKRRNYNCSKSYTDMLDFIKLTDRLTEILNDTDKNNYANGNNMLASRRDDGSILFPEDDKAEYCNTGYFAAGYRYGFEIRTIAANKDNQARRYNLCTGYNLSNTALCGGYRYHCQTGYFEHRILLAREFIQDRFAIPARRDKNYYKVCYNKHEYGNRKT